MWVLKFMRRDLVTTQNNKYICAFVNNIHLIFDSVHLTGLICLFFLRRELICPSISLFMDISCVKSL